MDERVALVDATNQFRVEWEASAEHCVQRFANRMTRLTRKYNMEVHLCWDSGRSWRYGVLETYKAGRSEAPEHYLHSTAEVRSLLGQYGLDQYEADGFEADDLLATGTKQALAMGYQVTLVTRDKDCMQLLDPGWVNNLPKPKSQMTARDDWVTASDVEAKHGVRIDQWVEYMMLVGDASDAIPGATGVGKKRAVDLLKKHGSIAEIFRALGEFGVSQPKRVLGGLTAFQEFEPISRQLITLRDDAPIEIKFKPVPF